MKLRQSLLTIYIVSMAILLSACNEPYLYDKTGFSAGGHPINPPTNPNPINRVAPDYYYRQSTPYYPNNASSAGKMVSRTSAGQSRQNSQPSFQNNNFRQPQNVRTQGIGRPRTTNYQNNSGGFVDYNSQFIQANDNPQSNRATSRDGPQAEPGSRFYSNPYSIPASNRYMRYDTDQYYTPPINSQNVEAVEYGIRNVPKY